MLRSMLGLWLLVCDHWFICYTVDVIGFGNHVWCILNMDTLKRSDFRLLFLSFIKRELSWSDVIKPVTVVWISHLSLIHWAFANKLYILAICPVIQPDTFHQTYPPTPIPFDLAIVYHLHLTYIQTYQTNKKNKYYEEIKMSSINFFTIYRTSLLIVLLYQCDSMVLQWYSFSVLKIEQVVP